MKKFFSLFAAVLFAGSMMAEEGLVYTLNYYNAEGAGNAYAATYDVTVDGIDWNVPGNATMNPVRIGGKNLSGVDRVIYSKTPITNNISKIEIEHGTATDITVNSLTVVVAFDATFETVISNVQVPFEANAVATALRPEGADWSNAYYKITYNVTVAVNSNKFVQLVEARFIGEGGTAIIAPDTIPATVAEAVAAGLELDSMATSYDVYEVTGYVVKSQPYSTDYKNQVWYMVDDATAATPETEFQAYGCTARDENEALQVIDGDKVVLKGKLTKYWNAGQGKFVIEIANGSAFILEKAEGDHTLPGVVGPDTITVARAVEIANALEEPAENGKSTTDTKEYVVKGYAVTEWAKNDDGTWSFGMADEANGHYDFQASNVTTDSDVAKNDFMLVRGKIAKRKTNSGKIQLQIYKGTAVHGEAQQGIENIELTEKAQKVVVDGVIYIIRDNKMFNLQGAQVR